MGGQNGTQGETITKEKTRVKSATEKKTRIWGILGESRNKEGESATQEGMVRNRCRPITCVGLRLFDKREKKGEA